MVESVNCQWVNELKDIGFEGNLLQDLVDTIGDENNMGVFRKYLTENDGRFRTQLSLVSRFKVYMKERSLYQTYADFSKDYIDASTYEQKKVCMDKLFGGMFDKEKLNKILPILENRKLTLEGMYKYVSKNRADYTLSELVTLIEFRFG
ncbi:hypothetical protein ABE137_12385 [Brevibacillus laterosporus]|uniref:hypothetical protein n=1 Tax=Brevibacillus phage Sundance TaxID=1691958 RepID=UPI0006BC5007|nr:hypothetical protein AVT09_gp154 [Brevibacillus phage Sundance]ALA47970.1 hypothetical protein SUNDANCE_154 [Brevibacillus phage Sundance]